MAENNAVSSMLSIAPGFLRSVHLERDFYASDTADGFLMTRAARSALGLLARGVKDASYRAQCISGPYGSGKSALALYFAKLLDKAPSNGLRNKAYSSLEEIGDRLIPPAGTGYITILATGVRESIAVSLIRSVKLSLEQSNRNELLSELQQRHSHIFDAAQPNTRELIALFEDLAKVAKEKEGALGVVVVVDELGKLLEHAALRPEDSDIQVLQEMAEAASRSHSHPLWFITILHQQFSQYASRLGRRHQRDWQKVQQRFFDVPCLLDGLDALRLVGSALNSSANECIRASSQLVQTIQDCSSLAPKGAGADFYDLCMSCYPLHPTVLVLLPSLFRKFGQNERSLFSFLVSDEPFSVSDWARRHSFDSENPAFLRLPDLYDYACNTLIGGAPVPQVARAWAEVEEAIIRLGDAPQLDLDVLKSIGLLGLVGESSHVSASTELLTLALASTEVKHQQITTTLQALQDKKLVVFRRYRNAYRLWEGSDVDINECLTRAYQALQHQSFSLTVARELCPASPLVARRHSFVKGMLRSLDVVPCSADEISLIFEVDNDSDGRVVQCLVEDEEQRQSVEAICERLRDPSVIVIIGKENDELSEAARDVAALEWVKKNTSALAGDRAARQELGERRLEAEAAFRTEWARIFDPGASDLVCYWNGNKRIGLSHKTFASLLSDACDTTFPYAPVVQNELINRRTLSSAAAKARRNLIEAMILASDQPGLGFGGYPPERSIYESLLLRSGIHRQVDDQWVIDRPGDTDPGLQKAWDFILASEHYRGLKAKNVAQLFRELSASPYGVADGFVPVLLCACLLANSATMALYENKLFVPELTVPVMERLMRRPETFSLVAFELGGERLAVVERFARAFDVECAVLPVVRSLYARMGSLPRYSEITRSLSPETIAMREVIQRAKSPEKLLFVDLPNALACKPFLPDSSSMKDLVNSDMFFERLNTAFVELIECYPSLLRRIRSGLARIFDVEDDRSDLRQVITERASAICEAVTEPKLRTLMIRAKDEQPGDQEYLESVAAGIVGQPPSRWSQADEEIFTRQIGYLAAGVQSAESARKLSSLLREGEDGYQISICSREGESVRRTVRFTSTERSQILEVAQALCDSTANLGNRRVLLAALTEATYRLVKENSSYQEDAVEGEIIGHE